MSLVDIRSLRVGYLRRREVKPVLHGVDLSISHGEVVALVGASGSGKTTLGQAIIGLLPQAGRIIEGSINVSGIDLAGASETERRRVRGKVVSLVPQDPMVSLNPTQRVGRQVGEAVRLTTLPREQVGARVLDLLQRAGLDDPERIAQNYPHQLSGGQLQRVLIAIALAQEPELIIADEPTSALDVTVQKKILDHLEQLVRDSQTSLLIITHDLAVAADRADRIAVMDKGHIVETGPPAQILGSAKHDATRRLIAAAPGLANGGRLEPRFSWPIGPRPEPVLTLDGVSRVYSHRKHGEFAALEDLFLRVDRGRTHALVGESGAGKSTALRIALGLERPTTGTVTIAGQDLSNARGDALRQIRRDAQLVQQNPFSALDPRFTVARSIAEPLASFKIGNRASRRAKVLELLDQVGLPSSFGDRLPGELSGGQRQRVAIARALALEPQLVLLDEPVSALDVVVQEQILDLLVELQERLSLSYLFVSHDLSVVAQIAHTVTILRKGRVVEEGPIERVFGSPATQYSRDFIEAIPGQKVEANYV